MAVVHPVDRDSLLGAVEAAQARLIIPTLVGDELMHAAVAPQTGLETDRRMSHVFVMDVPSYPRPLLVTDQAVPELAAFGRTALAEPEGLFSWRAPARSGARGRPGGGAGSERGELGAG
jgi:hypothetical protein